MAARAYGVDNLSSASTNVGSVSLAVRVELHFSSRASLRLDAGPNYMLGDANFVLTGTGGIVEIQATAEGAPFDEELFAEMLRLARAGIADLTGYQRASLGLASQGVD